MIEWAEEMGLSGAFRQQDAGIGVSRVMGQQLSQRPLRAPVAQAAAGLAYQLSCGLRGGQGAWNVRRRVGCGGNRELAVGPGGSEGRLGPGGLGISRADLEGADRSDCSGMEE